MQPASSIVKQRQLAIRREMDRRGIHMKVVASDSGIPGPTLATYFPQDRMADPAQIPGGAIYALAAGHALPADLLSLLMPEGWALVQVPEGIDHDQLSELAKDYLDTKMAAHRRDSPAGPALCPEQELPTLDRKVVALRERAA